MTRKVKRKISRGMVSVTFPGEPAARTYGGGDTLIGHPSMHDREVMVAYSNRDPSHVHILSLGDGRHIATVGETVKAKHFTADEDTKRAIANARRGQTMAAEQLQHLHQRTTHQAAERVVSNAAKLQRAVQTYPAKGLPERQPAATAASRDIAAKIDALHTIRRHAQDQAEDAASLRQRAEAILDAQFGG